MGRWRVAASFDGRRTSDRSSERRRPAGTIWNRARLAGKQARRLRSQRGSAMRVMTNVSHLAWPASQLGEAVSALALKSGLIADAAELPNAPSSSQRLGQWIEAAA